MTSKERMLRALAREKPDRMPATIHQWQEYHLDTHMGGRDALAAFGGRLALIGGLDQFNILTSGTAAQIRRETHRLFAGWLCPTGQRSEPGFSADGDHRGTRSKASLAIRWESVRRMDSPP